MTFRPGETPVLISYTSPAVWALDDPVHQNRASGLVVGGAHLDWAEDSVRLEATERRGQRRRQSNSPC